MKAADLKKTSTKELREIARSYEISLKNEYVGSRKGKNQILRSLEQIERELTERRPNE